MTAEGKNSAAQVKDEMRKATWDWARARVEKPYQSPARDAAKMLLDAEVIVRALLQLVRVSVSAGECFVGPISMGGAGRSTVKAAEYWLEGAPWYCEAPRSCEGPCHECWAEVYE